MTGSAARIGALALAVWAVVALRLGLADHAAMTRGYGDSDDATRLVMVRDLLHGQGWWSPAIVRLQPPEGLTMHWSRLLDGALALLDGGLSRLFGAAFGEWLARLAWPLLLIGPALAAALTLTRRLAGEEALSRPALWAAAAACAVSLPLYAQFHPGRIDHHNVQIVLWLTALAAAAGLEGRDRPVAAAVAGAATGLGLAIGLEALLLFAAIGAAIALGFAFARVTARSIAAYGLALAAIATAAFLVQTPPRLWGAPVCDALGPNLLSGLVAGGLGLAAASRVRGAPARLALVGLAGLAAAGVYLALNPHCLRGPFAEMDPALKGVWMDGVQEVTSLPDLARTDPATAFSIAVAMAGGALTWLAVGLGGVKRRSFVWMLIGLTLAIGAAQACAMLRMSSYLFWAAVPPTAAAAGLLAVRLAHGRRPERVRAALFGLILAPTVIASTAIAASRFVARAAAPKAAAAGLAGSSVDCLKVAAYGEMARLEPGLVLASPDLGPFILASTPHSALAAPYHRMGPAILKAHAAFEARADDGGPGGAEASVRATGARYVATCSVRPPAHDPRSLDAALGRGAAPGWLQPVSAPGAMLGVWRVRPAGG